MTVASGCSSKSADGDSDDSALERGEALAELVLTDAERARIVDKRATCPFVGAAGAMKKLLVIAENLKADPKSQVVGARLGLRCKG